MITLIEMLRRKKGLSKEEFRHHYETYHVALAKKYLGHLYLDFKRHYVNSSISVTVDGHGMADSTESAYDAITCIVFKDQAAVDEFFRIVNVPEVRAQLEEDEKRFLDGSDLALNFCEEVRTWTAADITAP